MHKRYFTMTIGSIIRVVIFLQYSIFDIFDLKNFSKRFAFTIPEGFL